MRQAGATLSVWTTSRDLSRPAPTTSIPCRSRMPLERYEHAGLPRTFRTIQRYCAKGHLDCRRVEIPYGEKYLISPASVAKHIAYIEETRQTMAGRDEPRPVATMSHEEVRAPDGSRDQPATGRDEPRQTAAEADFVSRYVARLEGENEFLRGQVTVKDGQIKEMTERARETNVLIAGLQKMLTPLLGRPATIATRRSRLTADRLQQCAIGGSTTQQGITPNGSRNRATMGACHRGHNTSAMFSESATSNWRPTIPSSAAGSPRSPISSSRTPSSASGRRSRTRCSCITPGTTTAASPARSGWPPTWA